MCDLEQYNLSKSYAALVGYQCGMEEGMPDTVCYLCARKLNKFKSFRAMSRRAYSILRGLLVEYDEISESCVREVDRKQNNLESTLTYCNIKHIEVDPTHETAFHLNHDQTNPLDNISKIFLESHLFHKDENKDMAEDIDSKDEVKSELKYEDDDEPMDYGDCYVSEIPAPKVEDVPEPVKKPKKGDKKLSKIKAEKEKKKIDKERTRSGKIEKKKEKRDKKIKKLKIEDDIKVVKRKRKLKREANFKAETERGSESPLPPATKSKYSRRKPGARKHTIYTLEYYESIAEVTIMTEEEQIDFFKRREHTSRYKEAPHRCEDCYLGFMYVQAYEAHRLKHDPSAGDKVCNICKIRLKNKRLLLKHISMTHRTKYACRKCDFVCSTSQGARLHASTHSDTTYYCEMCEVKFDQLKTYTNHMYVKHPKSVSCATCGVTFLGQGALNRHRARTHYDVTESSEGGEVSCEQCGVVFRNDEAYRVHRSTFPGHDWKDGLIGCEFCEEKFTETMTLQEHRKTHRTRIGQTDILGGGLECEQCGELLPTNRAYFVHFRQAHPDKTRTQYYRLGRHAGRAIMCEHCGRVFQSLAHYRDHMNKHIGEKPYKCDLCDKGFTSSYMRAEHRRVHTKEKPYTCELCNTQFSNQSNYRRHQNHVHTDATPFNCDICGKSFKYRRTVGEHIQFVHLKKPWPKRDRTRRKKTDDGDLEGLM